MSIKKIFSSATFLLVFSSVVFAQNTQIDFLKGGVSTAKTRAISEGKLYFAFFYTDWCLPCKWMEDNTFKDKDIIQLISQNYLAVKINIDDFDGHAQRQQYNVEFLPTIIVFNQGGDILGKYEESLSSTRFMEILRKHRFDMANTSVKLSAINRQEPKQSESQPKKEKLQVEEKATMPEKSPEKPVTQTPKQPETIVEKTPEKPKVLEKQVQDLKPEPVKTETPVEKVVEKTPEPKKEQPAITKPATPAPSAPASSDPSKYFAVQVGTFSRFENADAKRNEFKEIFGEGVHIKIDRDGKETIYRVMVGRYQTAEAARSLVGLLKEQGIDGFIREVSKD